MRNEQGTTEVKPEDVLSQLRNGGEIGSACSLILVEVIVGIQIVVAEELPGFAVELLRTALQRKTERSAGRNTVVRRIVAGQNLELRNGVHGWHNAHTARTAAIVS